MERALDYAARPAARAFSPGRLLLWLVYYAGWAGGWAVLGIVAVVALFERHKPPDVSDDVAFTTAPGLGAAAGVLSAVLARRSRWPQAMLMIMSAVAFGPLARSTWTVYGGGKRSGWDGLALLIYCALLAGSVCLLLAGAAGLLLNRRRGG